MSPKHSHVFSNDTCIWCGKPKNLIPREELKSVEREATNRCPTCADVGTVRYENIGHCKDSWHEATPLLRAIRYARENVWPKNPKTKYFLGVDIPPCQKNLAAVALGKLGGASKSERKKAASRANGAKHKPKPKIPAR